MNKSLINRRNILLTGGIATLGLSCSTSKAEDYTPPDALLEVLYSILNKEQKAAMCFPWEHKKRAYADNNWHVVDPKKYAIGKFYTSAQPQIIQRLFRSLLSPEGLERFEKQIKSDSGGFGQYTCAIFGTPGEGKSEWLLTGRHLTLRTNSHSAGNAAFGGPLFYGHATRFTEKADHPKNVWWHQAELANNLYALLSPQQQKEALLDKSPKDKSTTLIFKDKSEKADGINIGKMNSTQKISAQRVIDSLLKSFNEKYAQEARTIIRKNGSIEALSIAFYKAGDTGSDKIWDRWRIEGPGFIWYFRGSPHVHAWVNIAKA